ELIFEHRGQLKLNQQMPILHSGYFFECCLQNSQEKELQINLDNSKLEIELAFFSFADLVL
ncbi:MAG TPA: hypothetical protein DDY69_05420, partial [Deltaproteobacteria bacterium]|nr:hypothetical protein [Deltaproteobacteria bacterium]